MASSIFEVVAPATFERDTFGWITARLPDRRMLKSQSVEAHLLLAILEELQMVRFAKEPRP